MLAAVENGADAVYFGLARHNARARATNFDGGDLAEVMAHLHRRGVRGYVTLNTLVFPDELEELEETVRLVARAGVDAIIIQDLGLARLARAVAPELELHASTQMSVTSEEGIRLAQELGCTRVILARELSLREIARVRQAVDFPVEVFVHGALCVAYSGQCLTSEALGGRSANRGECAQACRMPYQVVQDGVVRDLGPVQYLLSPQDLAVYDLIPKLVELGVSSLKIEGRLKTPEYVANITRHYRRAIDAAVAGEPVEFTPRDVREMELSFSRGFSHGFLDGNDHKILVRGEHGKKRGIFLGRVTSVTARGIVVDLAAPVKSGDGLVLDGDESTGLPEQGGRVYEVVPKRKGPAPVSGEFSDGPAELRFGRDDLDPSRARPGQRVWKTDDPELTRQLRRTFEGPPQRLIELEVRVEAVEGSPLVIEGQTSRGHSARVIAPTALARAEKLPADEELIREQLDRLGGSIYHLGRLEVRLEGRPMVPKSLLNQLRRELVERLDESATRLVERPLAEAPVVPQFLSGIRQAHADAPPAPPSPALYALCRTTPQIEAAVNCGVGTIYADYQDIKEYASAVAAARAGGAVIFLAPPRIEKPFEGNLFRHLAKQGADGLLVRNAGGLAFCSREGIPFVADFSLNASNPLTVDLFRARGAVRVTASYDLNAAQLLDLLDTTPGDWLEVVVHQQIPMFHMEFCAFSAYLSNGKPHPDCGRPCDHHEVKLRDRAGVDHPLKADVGCRNTLFNATPQTAAEYLPQFLARGARHLRIEFLDDAPADVERTISLYRDALEGRRDAKTLWRALRASGKYGVTRGPLNVL
ncbi:MAG: DUF3656 domain-containing protein [Isosphaeraceae bacterium]